MKDGLGREIRYLRISVTDKCNLACAYCKPRPVKELRHSDLLTVEQLAFVAEVFVGLGVNKVRITGGEPLVRKGVAELVGQISALGCETVMTTNAVLFPQFAKKLAAAGLSRVNASLDTLDPRKYAEITGGGNLAEAVDGIRCAADCGFRLKINAVLQRGVNDDVLPLAEFAQSVGAKLRFIELMPFASTTDYFEKRFLPSAEITEKYGMKFVREEGNVAYYACDAFRAGFISPLGRKFCSSCDRMRLTSTGLVLPCLHSALRFDVKPYLGDREALEKFLKKCIASKPPSHNIERGELQQDDMGSIGG